jgi:hypothetical protein
MQPIAVAGYLELEFPASTLVCKTNHISRVSACRGIERNMPRVALICDTRRCVRKGRIGDKVEFRKPPKTRMAALCTFNKSCKPTKEANKRQCSFYCRNVITTTIFEGWQETLSRWKSL